MNMRYRYRVTFIAINHNAKVVDCDDWGYNDAAGFFLFQRRKDPHTQDAVNDPVVYSVNAREVFELNLLPEETDDNS